MSTPTSNGKNTSKLNGSPSDDTLNGSADSGTVDGKSGSDTVAGGDGNDWVKGGSSADRLIYRVADNTGTLDRYDGGSGADTLVLEMSRADWMRDAVQADIAAFLIFLQGGNGSLNGDGFVFASLNLEVRKIEGLEVFVDGVALDPRDEDVVAIDDEATTETEHSTVSGNVVANDLVPDLVRAVTVTDPVTQGDLTLLENGEFTYNPGNVFDYLAQGETAPVSFGYRVTDADHDNATARVNLTITGTNDTPVANADSGSTDENSVLLVDVLANDTDVDTNDTHKVDSVTIAAGLGSVSIVNNAVLWQPGLDYDYLAVGEQASVTVSYVESDNHGATATADLTITVLGVNDIPVANPDKGSTDENTTLTLDVLANDTDLDTSDTHRIDTVTLTSGLGSVAIVNNQVEWTPGTDYDSLALGETADVTIDYVQSDNNGASASSAVAIEVVGVNDAPVVETALTSEASEQDPVYTIDLLAGASDIDTGAVLSVANLSEPTGRGGWTLAGSVLTIDPDHFDKLNNGDIAALNFTFQVADEHGATVDQALDLTVNGFTDAPSLEIVATGGAGVNIIDLTITSQPADDERVVLSFRNLAAGTKVFNEAGVDVSAGLPSFSGTSVFSVVLPPNQDTLADLTVAVSGVDDTGHVIGEAAGVVPLSYDYSSVSETLIFSSEDQGIWASGDAPMVHWHQYLPLIGGVTQQWNSATKLWEDTGTGTWTSGKFPVFSSEFNVDDIKAAVIAVPQATLDAAKGVFNGLVAEADRIWNLAKTAYTNAVAAANAAYTATAEAAQDVFDAAINATAASIQAAAKGVYDAAVTAAAGIRDAAIWTWGWMGEWVTTEANKNYNGAVELAYSIYQAALDAGNWAVGQVRTEAQKVLDGALAAAEWVKNTANSAALAVKNLAEGAYNAAKAGVIAEAETIFNAAQNVLDDTVAVFNQVTGRTVVELEGEMFAEVGVKVDFVLDSGSVDTTVTYELTSVLQHNRSTDVLVITPQFTNTTTGSTVAFETISPNAKFQVALLYEVGAKLDLFVDSNLVVSGTTIYDISGPQNGVEIDTTLSTGGMQTVMDLADEAGVQGLAVGELLLIDFDSRDLTDFEIPFITSLTEDILTVTVGFPTVETSGIAKNYRDDYFDEGWFVQVHPSELIESILNLVTAKLDLSPELRQLYSLPSITDKTISEAMAIIGEAALATIFDALDGQLAGTPLFILDAKDETSNELIHGNFIGNNVIEDTLSENTAKFGFYAAYGESNDIVKVNIDIDQTVAVIVNEVVKLIIAAVSQGQSLQILDRIPTINPLDLSIGIDTIMEIMEIPPSQAEQIAKFFDLNIGFEAADLDVYSSLHFSQDFTMSIDDMSYMLKLEDGTVLTFAANQEGSIKIDNASSHDANGDGIVDYTMQIVPTAMFSNDTELGLSIGYVLDFLQATLAADLKLPIDDVLGVNIPGLPDITINVLDLHLGPMLRIQGDLDLASVDIFESRFDFDIGSATVKGDFETATPIGVIGIVVNGDQGLIV